MKSLRLITIGLWCVAARLAAQDTMHARHERMGAKDQHALMKDQMHEMMGPMMHVMTYAPDHLLSRKDSLGLTPQQVTRLTAIRDAAKSAHDAAAADAKAHMTGVGQGSQGAAPERDGAPRTLTLTIVSRGLHGTCANVIAAARWRPVREDRKP